jgi:hypothetical protein
VICVPINDCDLTARDLAFLLYTKASIVNNGYTEHTFRTPSTGDLDPRLYEEAQGYAAGSQEHQIKQVYVSVFRPAQIKCAQCYNTPSSLWSLDQLGCLRKISILFVYIDCAHGY